MARYLGKFAALLSTAFLLHAERALAVPGDYDGDGLADIAIIDSDEPENKTTVFIRQSSNGREQKNIFFPFGDRVISGSYFSNGKTYPGVVHIPSTGAITWHIKSPTGSQINLSYGVAGDTVPNQGDLDCDGVTDFAVARPGRSDFYPGFKLWYVSLSSAGGAIFETVFGLDSDKPYISDVDGNGCAELLVLRASTYQWISRPLAGDTATIVQWGLPGDIPLLPQDMNGDNVPDYMVVRVSGRSQIAYTRTAPGVFSAKTLGSNSSVPFAGNFYGSNTFGWFERSKAKFSLVRPNGSVQTFSYGNARRGVVRPDGVEVPENAIGRE